MMERSHAHPRSRLRRCVWLAGALALTLAPVGFTQPVSLPGFTTSVTAGLVAQYTRRFGKATPERIAHWREFAREQKAVLFSGRLESARGREDAALQIVNDAINPVIRWVDDMAHWGAEDYWATPAESIGSAGGDCEDYAIAKYYLLKELGVPIGRLRITYVRALSLPQQNQAHMVLAYYSAPDAEPLILDNLVPHIRRASQRTDLDPVYSFNDDDLRMPGGALSNPSQIRSWLALQQRLVAETRI